MIDNDTAGALVKRINGGEAFDLVVLTPGALEPLAKDSKVVGGSVQRLAKVAIGVAVKRGAPLPDISSVDAFKKRPARRRGRRLHRPGGRRLQRHLSVAMVRESGIADRIKPKAVLVPGGLVAQRLVNDQADLAIHQISEILAVPWRPARRSDPGRNPELHRLRRRHQRRRARRGARALPRRARQRQDAGGVEGQGDGGAVTRRGTASTKNIP